MQLRRPAGVGCTQWLGGNMTKEHEQQIEAAANEHPAKGYGKVKRGIQECPICGESATYCREDPDWEEADADCGFCAGTGKCSRCCKQPVVKAPDLDGWMCSKCCNPMPSPPNDPSSPTAADGNGGAERKH